MSVSWTFPATRRSTVCRCRSAPPEAHSSTDVALGMSGETVSTDGCQIRITDSRGRHVPAFPAAYPAPAQTAQPDCRIAHVPVLGEGRDGQRLDRKSTRLNSSH